MEQVKKEKKVYAISEQARINKYNYTKKWTKENTKMVALQLSKAKDQDLIDLLSKVDNRNGYIKKALRFFKENQK